MGLMTDEAKETLTLDYYKLSLPAIISTVFLSFVIRIVPKAFSHLPQQHIPLSSLSTQEQQAIVNYCHYLNIGSDRIETLVPDYKTRVYLRDNYCTKLS